MVTFYIHIKIGICIQQYRACIGLHNVLKLNVPGSHGPGLRGLFLSIFDILLGLASVASHCLKCMLIILFVLILILDQFMCTGSGHFTATKNSSNFSLSTFLHYNIDSSRVIIMINCFLYCMINIIHSVSSYSMKLGFKTMIKTTLYRVFVHKSYSRLLINIYTVWLFTINLILIILTMPNIVNPGPVKELNVIFQNVQGFVNLRVKSSSPYLFSTKVLEFQGYIFNEKPDVIILNETWLKAPIIDNEIFPNNSYKVFRRDRSLNSHPYDSLNPKKFRLGGGGVAMAFRSDLEVTTSVFKIKGNVAKAEILSVVVSPKSGKSICFSTLYRVGTLGDENLAEVKRHLFSITENKKIYRHILVGDFNLSKTSWPEGSSTCNNENGFLGAFNDLGLKQMVSESTHEDGNTLDLLLCNCPEIISEVNVLSKNTICNSDHFGIKFKVKLFCKRLKGQKRKIYNFKKADFKAINNELRKFHWDNILKPYDVNIGVENFQSIFISVCDKYIPKITIRSNFQPPWFDSELDSICKRKVKLLNKFKKTKDPNIYEEIKKIRKTFKSTVERKKRDNIINDDDPAVIKKKFWSYYKATSNSCRIPETMNYKGRYRSEKTDVADLFNKYFSDQFSSPSSYDTSINFEHDTFANFKFEENYIFNLLRKMNANKAAGPDGIHGKLLKFCASSIAKPLCIIYNKCFKSGTIPDLWKLGNIVPVFKKGEKSSMENYRPISLTCLSMKIFEYCIKELLMSKCSHLLDKRQHGFLPNKSCLTQMVPFTSELAFALNKSSRIDIVYFDFSKAFDTVNHDIIIHKLKHQYGIDGLLLQFIKIYLKDRKQQVIIGGSKSSSLPVYSGIPQGSILGPLLFVLFINDMFSVIDNNTSIALYADDTKIWREINCDVDQIELQKDIDSLYQWSINNKMKFHPDKCKALAVTNKFLSFALPFYEFIYNLNGNYLSYTRYEKDLGVHIDTNLNWTAHCKVIATKANQTLGFVRRTCHFSKCSNQRRVLYLALVRSIFEHCSPIWSPQTTGAFDMLDVIQRRAVKWIHKEPFVSYTDNEFLLKQKSLDLLPLNTKFTYTDLVLFHKIVYETVNIGMPNYIMKCTSSEVTRITRQNASVADNTDNFKYKCSVIPKVDAFKNSFFVRTYKKWNQVPLYIRSIPDSNTFSSSLKEHLWLILGLKPD